MRVLRLSVQLDWRETKPPAGPIGSAAVGGQAAQVARLTIALDGLGVEQRLLVSALADTPPRARLGEAAHVRAIGDAEAGGVHSRAMAWALSAARRLRRAAEGVDVVHVHASGLLEPLVLGALVPRATGLPLILTLHCSAQATYRPVSRRDEAVQLLTRAAERRAVAAAARTLVLSDRTRARLVGQGAIEVVPDAIDAGRIAGLAHDGAALRARLGVPRDAPLIAFVGRLSPEKGAGDLPDLAQRLAPTGAYVVAAGSGPLERTLRAAACRRLVLAGALPADDVARLLGEADVLVLPSRHEELGSVLLEAQAAGTVCVAAAVGGTGEAIAEGLTGLLVAKQDAPAMAAAVTRALEDPVLRGSARVEGPARARRAFDAGPVASRVRAIYESVCAGMR